jgi:type I restriction enzyme S subunit
MIDGVWKLTAIGELVQPVKSWNPLRAANGEPFRYIDLTAVDQESKRIVGTREVRGHEAPSRARQLVESGDVLVSTVRPNLNGVASVPPELDGATASTGFCVLRAEASKLDSSYLFHWVTTPSFVSDMVSKATGANYPAVTDRIIFESKIPLPPLAEQRRIAGILDNAESLRGKRRSALTEIDLLPQAIFLELFGDPLTNPKKWNIQSLGEIARAKPNNGIFRKNNEYAQEHTGLPVVWVEELFQDEAIDTTNSRRLIPTDKDIERYGLKHGDLLFVRSSVKLDGIAFNNVYLGEDDRALFECHLIRVSPDLAMTHSTFLNTLFRLPHMRAVAKSKSKTATMTTIDQQRLCSIDIPVPPLDLQREFARRVAAVEELKAAQRASLAKLDALFASLQCRAFRGEL